MSSYLQNFVARHYKSGQGLYSVCSAHPMVLMAAIEQALNDDSVLLVEATSNQVDQYGGYTGLTPAKFRQWIYDFAAQHHFPVERLILGGDHLGSNPWRKEGVRSAMDKAKELIRQYTAAGFTKIHLDCSLPCADDASGPLNDELVAQRAAELCLTAEQTARDSGSTPPVYVIGTEVPIAGGATHDLDDGIVPTSAGEAEKTISIHRAVFHKAGLQHAWDRVIALVVQPGVEFGNYTVAHYNREKAQSLSRYIAARHDMVFEAHSTDYQSSTGLSQLVEDHFAILKVGPWLSFAYREALFALDKIAVEMGLGSTLRLSAEEAMLANPLYWQDHYHGSENERKFARSFSYSDRIRYYWSSPVLKTAVEKLMESLAGRPIPMPLLSQYLPYQYELVNNGLITNHAPELLKAAVRRVLTLYSNAAC